MLHQKITWNPKDQPNLGKDRNSICFAAKPELGLGPEPYIKDDSGPEQRMVPA